MGKVIDVDEDLYKSISSDISSIASTLEGAKGKLEPCFSGELASYYSGSCNTELEFEIADSVTKIENTSVAIDASIDLYEKSSYFQYRYEVTMEGSSSNRDVIYSKLWYHFINNDNIYAKRYGKNI